MKLAAIAILLLASLTCAGWARATTLPDSCGDDKIKFDVKTENHQLPAPLTPPDGKALLVLIESENVPIGPFMHATIRFGMDGVWVGANNGNSYFTLTVDPGIHHLCASWQSDLVYKNYIDVTPFTAEPGQIYYFSAQVLVVSREEVTFALLPLNDDQGKFRLKACKFSTSKPKSV